MHRRARIISNPNVKLLRLYYPFLLQRAPELQFIFPQLEVHCMVRAGFQCNPFKSFQLPYRPRSAACTLMDVELNDGIAGAAASVCHIGRNLDRRSHLRRRSHFQIVKSERRITQAEAEGIKRRAPDIPIARLKIGRSLGKLREVMVVVDR